MKTNDLFDLVRRAQNGDKLSMYAIIERFYPSIRKSKWNTSKQEQDDLEQDLAEKIIKIVFSYNLEKAPDFSEFCNNVLQESVENKKD